MPPVQTPCFVFVLFLLLSHALSCRPFDDVVSSEQRRYLSYQQLGAPRAFTQPFFEGFLEDLCNYVQGLYKTSNLSNTCLTIEDTNEFYANVHDSTAVDRELADLKMRFPDLPYIDPSTNRMMIDNTRLERQSKKYLNNTYSNLSEGNVTNAALLPETSEVLFDPAREANLEVYQAHASRAPRMTAIRLLRIVTGMVLTLELAEVSRESSTQLLRHAVAWLSNMFRALQIDGPHVEVPVLFMPFYEDEFHRLIGYGRHMVPRVTEYDMDYELVDELDAYCHLDAWGRLEIIIWEQSEFAEVWTIETSLFDPMLLAKIAHRIGFVDFDASNYPPFDPYANDTRMDGWVEEPITDTSLDSTESNDSRGTKKKSTSRMYHTPVAASDPILKTNMRPRNSCIQPTYEYYSRPGVTWEQKCCAAICHNAVLMLQITLNMHDCCGDCNQAFCHTQDTPLADLAIVHLQPYGCNGGGYVSVSL